MLKFIKGHMSSIADIELFPLISFLIFFTVFIAMIIYVALMKKTTEREYAALAVDKHDYENENNTKHNR